MYIMKNSFIEAFGAGLLSLALHYLEKYIFNDWAFLGFLAILVMMDTLTSMVKNWKNKTVSSQGFSKVFLKVLLYGAFLILIHGMKSYEVNGERNALFTWIDDIGYAAIMAREALSIIENIAAVYPGLIPLWFTSRLKQFNEKGEFLKTEEKNG